VHELSGFRASREAALATATAASLAAILLWFGPPGTDFAAHAYQRALFLQHGFVLWNNFWYAGRYSFVTYSLLYYPLAAWLGIKLLAVLSIAVAAFAFAVVVGREWGADSRLSTRTFAVVWAGIVFSAAFPFVLGAALALLALWALQTGRRWAFAALALLTLAASPLALLLLGIVLAGVALARRSVARVAVPTAAMVVAVAVELLLYRLFPGAGRYPFSLVDFGGIALFCTYGFVLTNGVEKARLLRWFFLVYLVACAAAFIVPSELGGNVQRFRYAALPIALLVASLRRWRPLWLVVPAIALALSWNVRPLVESLVADAANPADSAAYWAPAVAFLRAHLSADYRVEAVDTVGHWPAVYLPEAGIPLARGWYRQADFPENAILYGKLGPNAYLRWLRGLGVRYVVLTTAAPDYSSDAEADLLTSGRSGLPLVFRSMHIVVYAVPRPLPLVTGPAPTDVLELDASHAVIMLSKPGTYRVAIRSSPYWRAQPGCIASGPDHMIRLVEKRAGVVKLDFKVNVQRGVQVLTGSAPSKSCR
jgi:hypothetical protein